MNTRCHSLSLHASLVVTSCTTRLSFYKRSLWRDNKCSVIIEKKLLLLFPQPALNITIPTNTRVVLIQVIKNWQQLLIRLSLNNVPRYLVNKYLQMKKIKYFYNCWNSVWIYFILFRIWTFQVEYTFLQDKMFLLFNCNNK